VAFLCSELNTTASQNDSNKTRAQFLLQLIGVELHWEERGGAVAHHLFYQSACSTSRK